MIAADLLMVVRAGQRRYLVLRDHVDQIQLIDHTGLPAQDARGRPIIGCALSDLLGLGQAPIARRQHALLVAQRRRSVAIIVERIETLEAAGRLDQQPLAPFLSQSLARPWFLSAAIYEGEPVLLLDLRRIAMDVAIAEKGAAVLGARPEHPTPVHAPGNSPERE